MKNNYPSIQRPLFCLRQYAGDDLHPILELPFAFLYLKLLFHVIILCLFAARHGSLVLRFQSFQVSVIFVMRIQFLLWLEMVDKVRRRLHLK